MQANAKVTLGGVEYELRPLTMRPAAAFRAQIGERMGTLVDGLGKLERTELDQFDQMAGLVRLVGQAALGSVDQIAEWLFEYSPELASDRERIEAEAYDDEIIAAFVEVLKQLFPFGSLAKSLTGLAGQAISTNSRSVNGGAGRTNYRGRS